jgi:hypothetical protein
VRQDSSKAIIHLPDEEELVAEALLTFLYTWDYAAFFVTGGGANASALHSADHVLAQAMFNIWVFVAADKYGVAALQQQAAAVFGTALFRASSAASAPPASYARDSSMFPLFLGQQPPPPPRRQEPLLAPALLTKVIDEVYNGIAAPLPDKRLRDVMALIMSYEISGLLREPAFVALLEGSSSSSGGCRHHRGFAVDAAKFLAQRLSPDQRRYRCPSCLKQFEALPHPRRDMACFHCDRHFSPRDWANNVVVPDVTSS